MLSNLSVFFKICFKLFCFPQLRLGKQNSQFPSGPTLLADGFFLLGPVTRVFRHGAIKGS